MKFKNYIETESGIKDTSTSPGTSGQVLSSTVAGTSWIDQSAIHSGSSEVVDIQVKNISSGDGGVNLSKGDPVYIYGSVGASPRLYVDLADADSTATNNLGDRKMPCVGLLDQDLSPNGEGTATVVGKLRNLITNPIGVDIPSENDTIYVKSGGGLTLTKPTGSTNLIQNVGQVGRVSTSADGNIVVAALLRSNDVPNLPTGKIWVGNANTVVSDVVYLDETNERMGINTTSPSHTLHVDGGNGIFVGDASVPVLEANSATGVFSMGDTDQLGDGVYITNTGTSYFDIYSTGSIKFRMDSNGNVGIGTTNPNSKLQVDGEIDANGGDGYRINGKPWAAESSNNLRLGDWDGEGFSTTIYDDTSAPVVTVTQGNVGIGTTSPNAKLHVYDTGNGEIEVEKASGALINIQAQSAKGLIGTDSNHAFGLKTNLTERLTVSTSGNVGLGTTNPSHKLQVVGNALVSGTVYINNTSSSIYRFFNELIIQNTASTSISIGGGPGGVTNNLEVNGVVTATASTDAYKGYIKQTIATIANEKAVGGSADYNLIPYNTLTTTTSNQYYNRMVAAYDGRIKKVYIRNTGGNTPNATVVNLKKQINNVTSGTAYSATVTGSGSGMSAYYDFANNDFTFNAGDTFGILYQTTDSGGGARTMGGVAISIIVEYNIT